MHLVYVKHNEKESIVTIVVDKSLTDLQAMKEALRELKVEVMRRESRPY